MKKLTCMILVLAFVFALAACGNTQAPAAATEAPAAEQAPTAEASAPATAASEESTEWVKLDLTVAAPFPEEIVGCEPVRLLQKKIDERMDGAIQFTIYGNGTLLAGTEIYDGVINGSADCGFWQTNYSTGRFPLCNLAEYPAVTYTGTKAASYTFKEFLDTLQPAELSDVHVLMANATGMGAIVADTEMTSMDNLAGKQVRATSISANVLSATGATPTSMEWSECYEGLRTGLVNGVYTHLEACANSKLHEVAPNILITPLYNSCNIIIMNKDIYDSMPKAQQELLDTLCDEVFEEFGCSYIGDPTLQPNIQAAIPAYKTFNYLEGEALEKAKAACEPITADYVKSLNDQGLDGDAALALLQELAEKYNEMFPAEELKELLGQYR